MIKDLQRGTVVQEERFAVLKVEERQTRTGKPYKQVTLSDPSAEIEAKIWSNAFNNCQLETGKIIEVFAEVGEYQGITDLNLTSCRIVEDGDFDSYLYQKPTLIFDIETVGQEFDRLGEWEQNYLLTNLEKDTDPQEAKQKTGLYSLYGFICSIGMLNPQTEKGNVLHLCDVNLKNPNKQFLIKTCKNEKQLLEEFWEIASKYECFVTFNGRGFDFPFLTLRSAINRVKIPKPLADLGRNQHIDLFDSLRQGSRGFKLEALTRALKIDNPKKEGISGLHVANLYQKGKHQDIANYVARDAQATNKLYQIWKNYLS